jgi:hypothetical protein
MSSQIKLLEKEKLDYIKANWDIPNITVDKEIIGLSTQQRLEIHLLLKIEELENRITALEEVNKE